MGLRPFHDSKAISSSTSSQVMAKKDRSSSNHVSHGLQCVYKDVCMRISFGGIPNSRNVLFVHVCSVHKRKNLQDTRQCLVHPKTEADGSNHHLEGSCFQFIDHICHLIKTESWISWILPSSVGADGHRIFFENPSSATTQRNKRKPRRPGIGAKVWTTSDIKEMLGNSMRIVENTQNAPIDSINENRWLEHLEPTSWNFSRHMLQPKKCTGRLSHIQRHKLPSGTAALEPARFCCAQRTMFSPDGSEELRSLVPARPQRHHLSS